MNFYPEKTYCLLLQNKKTLIKEICTALIAEVPQQHHQALPLGRI